MHITKKNFKNCTDRIYYTCKTMYININVHNLEIIYTKLKFFFQNFSIFKVSTKFSLKLNTQSYKRIIPL